MEKDESTGIQETQKFFLWKFDITLTDEEARAINERVVTAFTLLGKWWKEQRSLSMAMCTQREKFCT